MLIKLKYGPYEANGFIRHKTQRLNGLKRVLENLNFEVTLEPYNLFNKFEVWYSSTRLFQGDIRNLKFNMACEDDAVCQRVVAVLADFQDRMEYLYTPSIYPNDVTEGLRMAKKDTQMLLPDCTVSRMIRDSDQSGATYYTKPSKSIMGIRQSMPDDFEDDDEIDPFRYSSEYVKPIQEVLKESRSPYSSPKGSPKGSPKRDESSSEESTPTNTLTICTSCHGLTCPPPSLEGLDDGEREDRKSAEEALQKVVRCKCFIQENNLNEELLKLFDDILSNVDHLGHISAHSVKIAVRPINKDKK